jgi:tight adherence protein C
LNQKERVMSSTDQIIAIVFLLGTGLMIGIVLWKWNGRQAITERLETLSGSVEREVPTPRSGRLSQETLPKAVKLLSPVAGAERHRLQNRLIQAGIYRPRAMSMYLTVKLILTLGPVAVGFCAGLMVPAVSLSQGIIFGTIASGLGLVLPYLWLRRRTAARQFLIRRAIPEFLDVIVICLDAGLSFQAALQRVHGELESAFPLFTFELNIVLREVQLGMSTGEALQRFAVRSDMPEVRSLASVVLQSERYGASLTKALHTHAKALRIKRAQAAEENGQRASVKILFPTILFIFPAIFIVILGPAMIQIYAMMGKMKP